MAGQQLTGITQVTPEADSGLWLPGLGREEWGTGTKETGLVFGG